MSSSESSRGIGSALDAQVLVLNRVYSAIRIVDARRAFTLLAKSIAEVISLEQGNFRNYDFGSWSDIAELQREFESEQHEWVRTPNMTLAVPKIIRLLSFSNSSFRIPANPGDRLRFTTKTVRASCTERIGIP